MTDLNDKLSFQENGGPDSPIHTTLYELIDAVVSSTRSDEDHLTGFIVSRILDLGNVRLSKDLLETIR